jgi:hypothetical protein
LNTFIHKTEIVMEGKSAFLDKMEDLVKQVAAFYSLPCYLIDSKIETHTNAYGEVVRVPVVRIVGFFEDTITKVTEVLNHEFDLVQIKDANASGDTFTSSANSFQAGLKANRLELPEYKVLGPKKFEIRVSSILQDVYTAMQKGLSNGGNAVPGNVKRDFYRVGAFLEMADIEFLKIRDHVGNTPAPNAIAPPATTQIPVVNRTTQVQEPAPAPAPQPVAPVPQAQPAPAPVAAAAPVAATPVEVPAPKPEPEPVAPPAPPVVAATPAPVQQPAMPVAESLKITTNEQDKNKIDAIDMSVDSFNSLAVSIGSIESKNNEGDDSYLDLMTAPHAEPAATTNNEVSGTQDLKDTPKAANAAAPDAVALNIDKIDTFNMNVSGMIERTTEIIREGGSGGAPEKNTPFYQEVPADKPPVVMDENAQMSEASLKEYVKESKLVKEVDAQIAERAGAKINEDIDIEGDVERLRFLKVFTLKQLHEKIADNKEDVILFAEKWIGKDNGGSFDSGICLFYLEYLLVGKKNDPAFAVEYVLKFISDNDYSARYIIPTYNSIRQTGEPSSFAHLTLK